MMDMDIIKYVATMFLVVAGVWIISISVSKLAEDVHIISPRPGISCAVVSRAFNTSISCWKES